MTEKRDLRPLVDRALSGSREALVALIEAVQDDVYNVALRMLGDPSDAEIGRASCRERVSSVV